MIDVISEESKDKEKIMVGGFSQGASVALRVAMEMETLPHAVLMCSGFVVDGSLGSQTDDQK